MICDVRYVWAAGGLGSAAAARGWVVDRSVDWSVGRLVGRLVGWWVGESLGRFVGASSADADGEGNIDVDGDSMDISMEMHIHMQLRILDAAVNRDRWLGGSIGSSPAKLPPPPPPPWCRRGSRVQQLTVQHLHARRVELGLRWLT